MSDSMDLSKKNTKWKRMRFKRNKVWVAVDNTGCPVVEQGKAEIKYQLDQSHQYKVNQYRLHPLDENSMPSFDNPCPPSDLGRGDAISAEIEAEIKKTIRIYTHGACSGNSGPAGIGIVMSYQQHRKEISRSIGTATNSIAELEAINTGLLSVKNKNIPVLLFTDSSYFLGLLARGWRTNQNIELVKQIRLSTKKFHNLRFVKVRGQAKHPENKRADQLAVKAMHAASQ